MIEDGLLGPLQHPDVYEALAQKTRRHPASNRPRAVLFEGPPGCGKTTSARCASCAASHLAMGIPADLSQQIWALEHRNIDFPLLILSC